MTYPDAIALLEAAKVSFARVYGLVDEPKNLAAKVTVLADQSRMDNREIVKNGGVHDLHNFLASHHYVVVAVLCNARSFAQLRKDGRPYFDLVTERGPLMAGIVAWWKGRPDHYPVTHRVPFILSDLIPEDEVRTLDQKGNTTRLFWLDFDKV